MALKLLTAPAVEPVSLAEAKLHLRVDDSTDDTLITSLIVAARQYCEGFQNRAFITQTWELWLDQFPRTDQLQLPMPPLQSVTSIKYYDEDSDEFTFAASSYYVDVKSTPGWVCLQAGESWPAVTLRPANGVVITYVAGYGLAAAVPQNVKQAMLLLIAEWYDHRGGLMPQNDPQIPHAVDALLWLDRIVP